MFPLFPLFPLFPVEMGMSGAGTECGGSSMTDTLMDALTYAVADLPATVTDVRDWLAPEDVDDLRAGRIGPAHLRAFVRSRLGLLHDPDPMTTTTTEAA